MLIIHILVLPSDGYYHHQTKKRMPCSLLPFLFPAFWGRDRTRNSRSRLRHGRLLPLQKTQTDTSGQMRRVSNGNECWLRRNREVMSFDWMQFNLILQTRFFVGFLPLSRGYNRCILYPDDVPVKHDDQNI